MFETYLYRDPVTRKPRYVGKGKGNRAFAHLTNADNKTLRGWIRNLKAKGKKPIIEYYPARDADRAFLMERFFIALYGRVDIKTGSLFNHTPGGDNPPIRSGKDHHMNRPDVKTKFLQTMSSPEYRQKMRALSIKNGNKPPVHRGEENSMKRAEVKAKIFTPSYSLKQREIALANNYAKHLPKLLGDENPMRRPEVAAKMAAAVKGSTKGHETRVANGSYSPPPNMGGTIWVNDGIKNRRIKNVDGIPDGYAVGRI